MQTTTAAPVRALPQFPDSVLRPKRSRWRHRARTALVIVLLVGLATSAALVARRVTADDETALRTATSSTQSISGHFEAVAAVEPVARAQVAFPVDGTVTSVDVAVGDTVQIGDSLASIDATQLEQGLRLAESTLASTQLTLNVALSGEDPNAVGAGGATGSPIAGVVMTEPVVFEFASPSVTDQSYELVAVAPSDIAAARQAIVSAQSAVSSAGNDVGARRDAAASICNAVDVTIDPNDPNGSIAVIGSSLGACQSALADLVASQDALTTAQSDLTAAADTFDGLLADWAAELDSTPTPTTPTSTTTTPTPGDGSRPATTEPSSTLPTGSTPTLPSGGTGQPTGGGSFPTGGTGTSSSEEEDTEPTASELISYQASHDAAVEQVEAARQALAQASLVSPLSGTVVSVDIAPGDSVSASSDTATVVIEGESGFEATLSVSVDDIEQIAVGQPAELTADGVATAIAGEVVAIAAVPDDSSGTANYRVTVGLAADDGVELTSGNVGDVAIEISGATDVVAVPASAVTPTANGYTVDVVDAAGVVKTVRVQIGAIGAEWIEIRSGIETGQTVVLADITSPLPGVATDVSTTEDIVATFPGGGVFPGGGAFPGGG